MEGKVRTSVQRRTRTEEKNCAVAIYTKANDDVTSLDDESVRGKKETKVSRCTYRGNSPTLSRFTLLGYTASSLSHLLILQHKSVSACCSVQNHISYVVSGHTVRTLSSQANLITKWRKIYAVSLPNCINATG